AERTNGWSLPARRCRQRRCDGFQLPVEWNTPPLTRWEGTAQLVGAVAEPVTDEKQLVHPFRRGEGGDALRLPKQLLRLRQQSRPLARRLWCGPLLPH